MSETSFDFRRILLSLLEGNRIEGRPFTQQEVDDDAVALHKVMPFQKRKKIIIIFMSGRRGTIGNK